MPLNSWLLINYSPAHDGTKLFPLGIAYISSILKQAHCFSVHCLDLAFLKQEQHEQAVLDALRTSGAGVVGINGFSNEFNAIKSIINSVRSYDKNIVIVGGGHMVSSDAERIHSWLPLDFAVVGEGEETILELAHAIASQSDYSAIPGIVYREGTKSVKTTERKSKNDINDIPFPDYIGFDLVRYLENQRDFPDIFNTDTNNPRLAPLLIARSCPYKCTFCSHSIKQYRKRKLDAVFAEIDLLVSTYGVTGLQIMDDLFAVDAETLEEFCRRISPTGLTWSCQVRADMADRALLKLLRSSGCTYISYGFESIHDDVLLSMKKQMSSRDIKAAARITYESKLSLQANFIFGDSAETIESLDKTMNWWAANRMYGINLATILVFPGTALYGDFVIRGIITDELDYIEKGLHFVNGTNVPMPDYLLFLHGLQGSKALTIPCHVVHIEATGNNRVNAKVICPHCDAALEYDNAKIASNWVMCRECFARFFIPVIRALGRKLSTEEQTEKVTSAIELLRQRKHLESKELAEGVVSVNPYDVDAVNTLATACLCLGEIERAKTLFWHVLTVESANAIAHNNYGVCLGYYGQLGWSLLHFKQGVFLDNNETARINADISMDWLQKNFDTIPFVNKTEGFPNNTLLIAIPNLSDGSSCVRRAPLRESLACHPLSGLQF